MNTAIGPIQLLFWILLPLYTLPAEAVKLEGKIYYDNFEVDVFFEIPLHESGLEPDIAALHRQVIYYGEGNTRHSLMPSEASGIQFYHGDKTYRLVSVDNANGVLPGKSSNLFLELKYDGPLSLYVFYRNQSRWGYNPANGLISVTYSFTPPPAEETLILQKEGQGLLVPVRFGFRKKMQEYLRDCPDLCDKIDAREFRFPDLQRIAEFYKTNCP